MVERKLCVPRAQPAPEVMSHMVGLAVEASRTLQSSHFAIAASTRPPSLTKKAGA